MKKRMRVKNYSSFIRQAKMKVRAKGKVKVKAYGGGIGTGFGAGSGFGAGFGSGFGAGACGAGAGYGSYTGPSLQSRLYGWAVASTLVTVNLENSSFRGRVISVDGNGFEVTVTDPGTSLFTVGAIVYVNFYQVNAVSAGNF
jgi:hypothetical protein